MEEKRIIVSACLLGLHCKYNGGENFSPAVAEYVKGHKFLAVCPEQLGGLPTPRIPAEIVNGVVTNRAGVSVDAEFRRGAAIALRLAEEYGATEAVLQSRSPSCGCREIYDGTFTGTKKAGQGVFTELLTQAVIKVTDADEVKK